MHRSGHLDSREVARVEGDKIWLTLFAGGEEAKEIGPYPVRNYTYKRREWVDR